MRTSSSLATTTTPSTAAATTTPSTAAAAVADAMDLAIRVNVRYAAPPNSQIKDALRMFKSARWVQSIIRYILPQLHSVSPAAASTVAALKQRLVAAERGASCVVCMETLTAPCAQLACRHQFHVECIEPWLKMHSTCPTCRDQLPTDAASNYSVYAINTTIILQPSQAQMPPAELLELSASNQVIRAVVNARVRRNALPAARSASPAASTSAASPAPAAAVADLAPLAADPAATTAAALPIDMPLLQMNPPVMNANLLQRSADISAGLPPCIPEPVVPMLRRNASRRRLRRERSRSQDACDEDEDHQLGKRRRLERGAAAEREAGASGSLRVLRRR